MAGHNLSFSGSTGVLEANARISEVTTTGTRRKLHLYVYVKPVDYSGARTFGYDVYMGDSHSGEGNKSLDGGGYTIYDSDFYVDLPYGSTTASINFRFNATVVSPSSGNKTITGSITKVTGLTLAQGSTSLTGAGSTEFNSACSITWTPSSSSMYYKLRFSLGSWSDTTEAIHPGGTSSYTYTGYTIPLSAAQQIPNAVSAAMTATLYTYSDSGCTTQVGSASSMSFTVTLPDNTIPSISNASITINNSENEAVAGWGIAVAGFTRLNVVASASGAYGSSVSRFIIEGAYDETINEPSLNYVGSVIQSPGTKSVKITCIDSRGRKSAPVTTSSIDFSAYSAPSISQFTAERNADGKAVLKVIYSYKDVGNNNASASLQYKQSGSDNWIVYGAIENNTAFMTDIVMSDESSYTFKVVVTDSVGSSIEKTAFLSTAKVLLDFKEGGDGLGVGKICETPALEVAFDAKFYKSIEVGELTLEQYIQSIMKILPSHMYGDTLPASGEEGQIFFKKM